jgi:hypothetical protein
VDRSQTLPVLVALASLLCVTLAPLEHAVAAPAALAADWAAPWDTLSGPLDVPSFDYPRAIHDPLRHRIVALAAGNPTEMWVMPLPASGKLAWTQVDIHGPMPPARERFAAVYDSLRDRILVYGGFPVDTTCSDVWALSLAGEPQWSPVATLGTPPPRDRSYTLILDTNRDRLVVFGGQADSASHISDLWELSLTGTPTWAPLSPLHHPPWPRVEGSAVYDRWHDRMIFFAGQDLSDIPAHVCDGYLYSDTWALDFSEPVGWSPLDSAVGPAGRMEHTTIVDTEHRQMVVEGGHSHGTFVVNGSYCWPTSPTFEDAWALNLDGQAQWTPLPSASRATGNYTAAYSPERGSEIVFSGNWAGCYELNLRTPGWSQVLPAAMPDTFPLRQPDATLLVDRERERLLMFGGGGSGDLWSFALGDTTGWRREPSAGYGPFSTQGMNVYDSRRNRLIAFSGGTFINRGATIDQVWVLPIDGAHAWTAIPAQGLQPPARVAYSAIYDPVRDRVLLFGGLSFANPSDWGWSRDDLWDLSLGDTLRWRQLVPIGTPGIRYLHTALFDALRDRMLVYGGDQGGNLGNKCLHDTWALPLHGDSLAWVLVNTEPPDHADPLRAMLDPLRDRLLVLAADMTGRELSLADPSVWRQLPIPGRSPLPREGPGVTFDPSCDELLMFGGTGRADLYALRFSAAAVRLESAESDSDHIALAWSGMFPGEPMEVQRSEADSAWVPLAVLTADSRGRLEYVDQDFVPGRRYGYRLAVPGAARHYDETWLAAPGEPAFGFRGAVPNPGRHGLTVAFTLTNGSGARLEVYDLAGRRVLTRDLGGLVPGPHHLDVDAGTLRPGVYLLRLVQGPRAEVARAVVLR